MAVVFQLGDLDHVEFGGVAHLVHGVVEHGPRHADRPWSSWRSWSWWRRFQNVVNSFPNLVELLSEVLKEVVGGGQFFTLKLVPEVVVLINVELLLESLELVIDLVVDNIARIGFKGFL